VAFDAFYPSQTYTHAIFVPAVCVCKSLLLDRTKRHEPGTLRLHEGLGA